MAKVNFIGSLPFCPTVITNGSLVGANTQYPIGLTLEGICYWFWKIRLFSVNYSASGIWGGDVYPTPASGSFNGDLAFNASQGFVPIVETDLVCSYGNSFQSDDASAISAINGGSEITGKNVNILIYYEAYFYNGLYYPKFTMNCTLIGTSGTFVGQYVTGSAPLPALYIPYCAITIDLGIYGSFSFNAQTADINTSVAGTCLVTVGEEWPYMP
jgi:hypothetical protein